MSESRKQTESTPEERKQEHIISNEDGGGQHRDLNKHPLLNHLLLERIFPHLNVQDLAQVQQVCKIWHITSLKIWRSRTTVTLVPACPDSNTSSKLWPVNQFCRQFQDSSDIFQLADKPFKGLILKAIDFQQCPLFEAIDAPVDRFNFCNDVGPFITHLHFHSCTFDVDSQQVLENVLTDKLPNLEMLQFTENNTSNRTGWPYFNDRDEEAYKVVANSKQIRNLKTLKIIGHVPISPVIILLISPNIESLHAGDDWDFNFLHTVNRAKVKVDGNACQLKHLDLMECTTHGRLYSRLQRVQCPLEDLSFSVKSPDTLTAKLDFYHVEFSFAKTLQVLKVFRLPAYRMPYSCPFVFEMPALRELHLLGNMVKSFRFIRHMPNLEVLYVDYHCLDKTIVMEKFYQKDSQARRYIPYGQMAHIGRLDFPETGGEKMKILHINAHLYPRYINKLAKAMPNLKVLRTVLQNTGFRQVCTRFPNLEELVLLFDSKVRIDQSTQSVIVSSGYGKNDHKFVLKNLKRFELHVLCDSSQNEFRINDDWVYKFLLRLPSLQHVYISASKLMTPRAEEALRKHVWNVTVIKGKQGDLKHNVNYCKLCSLTNVRRSYEDKYDTTPYYDFRFDSGWYI